MVLSMGSGSSGGIAECMHGTSLNVDCALCRANRESLKNHSTIHPVSESHCGHGKTLKEDCMACDKMTELEERKYTRIAELEGENSAMKNLIKYIQLLQQLHQFIAEGKDDTGEAEEVREDMDGLWPRLIKAQQEFANKLSVDLYRYEDYIVENEKLKKANLSLRNKLDSCYGERNQMHRDNFESVDFGHPYD